MKHSNVINFLSGSMWLSTDDQMAVVARIADSIVDGTNPELREKYLAENPETITAEEAEMTQEDRNFRRGGIKIEGNRAIVPIHGTIAPKANMMMSFSGGVSAELLTANINSLTARDDVKYVILDVDSNGGSVHGIAAAAAAIRNMRESGKTVFSVANYNMNSAAYWIASAAEKIFVTPTSVVGSIGVVSILKFASEEDSKGVEIIRSVPGKIAINPFEPLSDDARKKLQSDIDTIHASFVEAVSLNRNIDMSKANKLANGETKLGDEAVAAGLADQSVESLDAVLAEIDAIEDMEVRVDSMRTAYVAVEAEKTQLTADLEATRTELSALKAEIEADEIVQLDEQYVAAVDAAIDAGRIPAGLKEENLSDLRSNKVTLESFNRIVGNISAGAVVPDTELEAANPKPEASDNPDLPSNELEIKLFRSVGLPIE
jgi:ClpP class serine protease